GGEVRAAAVVTDVADDEGLGARRQLDRLERAVLPRDPEPHAVGEPVAEVSQAEERERRLVREGRPEEPSREAVPQPRERARHARVEAEREVRGEEDAAVDLEEVHLDAPAPEQRLARPIDGRAPAEPEGPVEAERAAEVV